MAIAVMIIGESGTGKSTSIRTLNPEETFVIQVVNKPLPFKNSRNLYKLKTKENKGNRFVVDDYKTIEKIIETLSKDKKIKSIVIDDVTYLMTKEFMRTTEKGYEKFTNIAQNFYFFLQKIEEIEREDLIVFLMGHQQEKENGKTSIKTIGKMIDDKITIEGFLTIVFDTVVNSEGYFFNTQNNGFNTSKSPIDMFETTLIPNDLEFVKSKIYEYYNIGTKEKNNEKGDK